MSDSLPYWKFYAQKWVAGNIQAHDMETQGIYLNLCARAWMDGGYVEHDQDKLARLLRVKKQVLANAIRLLLHDGLLVEKEGAGLSSKFILLQLSERNDLSGKRSEAGRKGGQAKQLNRRSKCQANEWQTPSILELESESEKEVEIEKEESKRAASARPRKTFEKPTLEAVLEYVAEINAGIDPQGFIDHYESNGWKVGRNSMKDWKATVRKWKANRGTFGSNGNGNGAQRNGSQAPQAVTKRNAHLIIEEGAAESWK